MTSASPPPATPALLLAMLIAVASRQEKESSFYSLSKQEKTEPGGICLPPVVTNLCNGETRNRPEDRCQEAHGEYALPCTCLHSS